MRSPWIAAAAALLVVTPAAAQDPPPPLPPADVPPESPPALPPPTLIEPPAAEPTAPEPPATPPAAARRDETRTLKGHTFRPPILLDTAFVTTHAGVDASIGHEVTSGRQLFVSTAIPQTLTYDATSNIVTGTLHAGVAILGRIEIGLDASYAGSVAGDQSSAILDGGQSAFDVRPGVRIAALRSPGTGTQLGFRVNGVFTGSTRLDPGAVLAEVGKEIHAIAADADRSACLQAGDLGCALDKGFDAFTAMRISRATYGAGASASVAQAFGSHFGLQATAGLEIARATSTSAALGSSGSTPFGVHVGVAPSLDLAPAVPIGLSAEYRFDFVTESYSGSGTGTGALLAGTTSTLKHGVAAGLYYTGRSDLVIGAAFVGSFASGSADGNALPPTSTLSGLVTMRYFF